MILTATITEAHGRPTQRELSEVVGTERRFRTSRTVDPVQQWHRIVADRLLGELTRIHQVERHRYTPGGRPFSPDLFLAASHDTSVVAAAAARTPIGIDIVDVRRFTAIEPHYVLGPAEAESAGPILHPRYLATVWAVKEAVTKRWGVGLAVDPRDLVATEGGGGSWQVARSTGMPVEVRVRPWGASHLLAVSCANAPAPFCPKPTLERNAA